jgi:hypothetical protein
VDLLAEDARIAAEHALPQVVAEHHDRRIAGAILGRFEPPAQHRPHAEQRQQLVGGVGRLHPDRAITAGQRGRAELPGRDRRAAAAAGPEVPEVGRRQPDVRQVDLADDVGVQPRQPVRLVVRQRPQDDRVDDAEDRRGRADAEREGDDQHRGQPGRLPHHAERVPDIEPQRRHAVPRSTPRASSSRRDSVAARASVSGAGISDPSSGHPDKVGEI